MLFLRKETSKPCLKISVYFGIIFIGCAFLNLVLNKLMTALFEKLPETTKIINKETLSYLKKNTVIGNAARGDVVDDDAMVEAIKNGTVFAYGLDVYNGEPKIHPEYLKLKNIFLLPHLGSATKRTRWDMAYRATKNLEDFFSGKKPQDQVN